MAKLGPMTIHLRDYPRSYQKEAEAERIRRHLDFVVRFVNQDLEKLRDSGWLGLREGFSDFFSSAKDVTEFGGIVPQALAPPEELGNNDIQALQEQLREYISEYVSRRDGEPCARPIAFKEEFIYYSLAVPGLNAIILAGEPRGVFRFVTMWLLSRSEGDAIRACPECGKFFARNRRQKFCDSYCANKVAKRAYLQREEERNRKRKETRRTKKGGRRAATRRRPSKKG